MSRLRRPPVTDQEVLASIKELQANGETISQRVLHERIGGSYSTLTEILQRLNDQGQIRTAISRERLLQACLARRSEQVNVLLRWAGQVTTLLADRGGAVPPLPECLGPAQLGSAQWPYPGADARELLVIVESDGLDEARHAAGDPVQPGSSDGLIWLYYEAREVDGVLTEINHAWAVGTRIPSSATLTQHLLAIFRSAWVSASAVDTPLERSESSTQALGTSDCAAIKTPAPEGSRSPEDGFTADRRSVPPRERGSARHPDRWTGGQ
jgi:hypothetical protein